MCEDVVERGDLTANECKIRNPWWDDIAIEVKAILFDVKLALDYVVEQLVGFLEACFVNNEVTLDFLAVGEDDTVLHEVRDGPLHRRHLVFAKHFPHLVVENLSTVEDIDLDRPLQQHELLKPHLLVARAQY